MRLKAKWIIILGAMLVTLSFGLLIFIKFSSFNLQKQTDKILSETLNVMPPKSNGTVAGFSQEQMPAMEIDGEDIIGTVEFENISLTLPIGNNWNNDAEIFYPKRFGGTVYDNSLVIGGCDLEGQFDALKKIDIGHKITVTDMSGSMFKYEVKDIIRKKSVNSDSFKEKNTHLFLFVRNSKSDNYIIVRCVNSYSIDS